MKPTANLMPIILMTLALLAPGAGGWGQQIYFNDFESGVGPEWSSTSTAVTPVGIAQPCIEPPSDLISWWPGDTDASDIWNGNDGVLTNGAQAGVPGWVDGAFSFDGVDDYVVIPNSPNLNPTDEITLEAWAFPTHNGGAQIISKDDVDGPVRQYMLSVGAGAFRFRPHVGVPSGFQWYDGSTFVQADQWYHVAMTYDGSSLRLYVNGNPDGSMSVSGSIITSTVPVMIGSSVGNDFPFQGLVDEARIYNRALSAAEINAIYNAGRAGMCKVVTAVHSWQLYQ